MDVASALFDPELGSAAFTVERITYTRSRSGTTSRTFLMLKGFFCPKCPHIEGKPLQNPALLW